MENREDSQNLTPRAEEQSNDSQELISSLPKVKNWDDLYLYHYQGTWYHSRCINGVISFQNNFQAQDSDVILATFPKSGTTWLKALTFAIVHRSRYPLEKSPLLTSSPHDLVPFLEFDLYMKSPFPSFEHIPTPRILSTHMPCGSLPKSIMNSNCRVVYMCRNPMDQFISHWTFYHGLGDQTSDPLPLEEAFEMICQGVQSYGPIWTQILDYWNASKAQPGKILFLKYEDLMKGDIVSYVKQIAEFLGCPFSESEETQGVVEEISKLCSFDNMKNLEVNKSGKQPGGAKNDTFFRKGIVGDWKNYLTPAMSERLEKLMEEKFHGSGLTFKTS